jgi:hypothetical protein
MSNKTPPLVIPVVIDSTGVDRGLSNVNNRLRRGVSGTGAGGGGGGGFGSGGALAAAALGAGAAAAVSRSTPSIVGDGKAARQARQRYYEVLNNRNAISRGLNSVSEWAFNKRNAYHAEAARMQRPSYMGNEDWRLNPAYNGLMAKGDWWGGGWGYDKQGKATAPMGQRFRGVGMMLKNASTKYARRSAQLGNAFDSLTSLRGVAGVGAAIAGAGAGLSYLKNFDQYTSDIENLRGSPLYGQMRNVQKRQAMTPKITNTQGFLAGGLLLTGGQETSIERHAKQTSAAFNDIFTGLGLGYEAFFGGKMGMREIGNAVLKSIGL